MMKRAVWIVCLALVAAFGTPSVGAEPQTRLLTEFGDISSEKAAKAALAKAVKQLVAEGGGVLVIPTDAPENWKVWNTSQADLKAPAVTIVDLRQGRVRYHVPPIGTRSTNGMGGMQINRMLNMAGGTLGHCTTTSAQSINSYAVSGATSYMATLTKPIKPGKDVRAYVDLIRGIWPGQFLNVTGSVMSYREPFDRIIVKDIGWDPKEKRNYFVADFDHEHPIGALVYNKHMVMGQKVYGYSNCDNQTAGLLGVMQHQYGVGDNFVISGMMKYMSDVFSGFGDEGAVVINSETVGLVNMFASTVEKVDWSDNAVTYAKGISMPHTLSNSRPLVNMNKKKWVTAGHVYIVQPQKTFRGKRYDGKGGGPGGVFNYQGGLILGSKDCGWTDQIIGRFFCVTDDTEVILPNDKSVVGGYAKNPRRPAYRWYRVMTHDTFPDGMHVLRILRVRWSAVAAGAPNLFVDDNYTFDGHERPLKYAIAPGAWVYDISEGWADTRQTGGNLYWDHPRKLRVVPTGDRDTKFDFEPGDEIEQPVGPDPWQPRPIRIRQFDQMPDTMEGASIEVQQNGRVQVTDGIRFSSPTRSVDGIARRKDRKAPYKYIMNIYTVADVGINFGAEMLSGAIYFHQPRGHAQAMRWMCDDGVKSLLVPPATGNFTFAGGNIDNSGHGIVRSTGISGTDKQARNLRGINVPVKPGAESFQVRFGRPEPDANYAVSITPDWMTPYCVRQKTQTGFTVQFGTEAPTKAKLDWIIVR